MRVYFLAALCLFLVACRKDAPPPVTTCILNGTGIGFCTKPDGTQHKLLPSQMKGFTSMSPEDTKAYVTWCYTPDAEPTQKAVMEDSQ